MTTCDISLRPSNPCSNVWHVVKHTQAGRDYAYEVGCPVLLLEREVEWFIQGAKDRGLTCEKDWGNALQGRVAA